MDSELIAKHLKELLADCDELRTKLQQTIDHLTEQLRQSESSLQAPTDADARSGRPP